MTDFNEIIHPEMVETERDTFVVDSDIKADWAVGKIAEAEAKIAEMADAKQQYIDKINAWFDDATSSHRSTIEYMTEQVKPWAERQIPMDAKKKSIKLPSGSYGFRNSQAKVLIDDEEKAMSACKELHPEAIKESLSVSALKDIMKKGELVDGCSVSPVVRNFYVKAGTK